MSASDSSGSDISMKKIKKKIKGEYVCLVYDEEYRNDWHFVTISKKGKGEYEWENRAGVSWTLTFNKEDPEKLIVGSDCCYYNDGHKEAELKIKNNKKVTGILGPHEELFTK